MRVGDVSMVEGHRGLTAPMAVVVASSRSSHLIDRHEAAEALRQYGCHLVGEPIGDRWHRVTRADEGLFPWYEWHSEATGTGWRDVLVFETADPVDGPR